MLDVVLEGVRAIYGSNPAAWVAVGQAATTEAWRNRRRARKWLRKRAKRLRKAIRRGARRVRKRWRRFWR